MNVIRVNGPYAQDAKAKIYLLQSGTREDVRPMAFVQSVSISGFRSYSKTAPLQFGQPDGRTPWSGLTVIVGPNNGGKSSLLEGLELCSRGASIVVPKEDRHRQTNYECEIKIVWSNGQVQLLKSDRNSAEKLLPENNVPSARDHLFFVPAHRSFPESIPDGLFNRTQHLADQPLAIHRKNNTNLFGRRVRGWRSERFEGMLDQVVDQNVRIRAEGGATYVSRGEHEHSLKGLGDGIVSVIAALDALRDAETNTSVVIEEPEIGVHPSWQRRLMAIFKEESTSTQIVYSTHSPFMIDWRGICSHAELVRIALDSDGYSHISMLTTETKKKLGALLEDINNPHTIGIAASEALFLADKVILVEGQEDVVCFRNAVDELQFQLQGEFFGWGTGGASKMEVIASLLQDLGFRKVFGILDNNKKGDIGKLQSQFAEYRFESISTDNVRDRASHGGDDVKGLCTSNGKLKPEFRDELTNMLQRVNDYFRS